MEDSFGSWKLDNGGHPLISGMFQELRDGACEEDAQPRYSNSGRQLKLLHSCQPEHTHPIR